MKYPIRIARAAGVVALAAVALGSAGPRNARAATESAVTPAPATGGGPPAQGRPNGPGPWMPGPWMQGPWRRGRWDARGATEWIVIQRPLGPEAGRRHRPRPWVRIARGLQLTATQRESARAIWRDGRDAQRRIHRQMRANAAQLRAANPDAPTYAQLLAHVSRANGALFSQGVMLRGETRAKFYRLLTPGQKATLARWNARREAMRRCAGAGAGRVARPPITR
ncbi:MAG: Spy/CpxP family protein refolding chaperone [Gammaproteobacteria bacterium]|nr:Spy/CpxP family protein refolding chaperone [Gammaproteobacteria bacterium]